MNKDIKKHTEDKMMLKYCVICATKIIVHRLPNRRYKGGNYFGRIGLKEKFEYWECDRCFNE